MNCEQVDDEGREFVMKDMYSFSQDADQHEEFYQKTIDAYMRCIIVQLVRYLCNLYRW